MNSPETYSLLQHYWFFIDALLGGILVFLLFVQGGQTFIFTLAKGEAEKTLIVNTLGRKWEFTFTTLVTFGGAFFASFPLFYATSFGGAYWLWYLILFAFVIQAVSYEFRSRPNNFLGKKTFDLFLFINGTFGTLLLGIAVSTFFTGSMFEITPTRGVIWHTPYRGLEALFNVHSLSLGFSVFFLARINALLYFLNSISDDGLSYRSKKSLWPNTIGFLVSFLTFVIWLLVRKGFAINPENGEIFMDQFKYLNNLLQMPIVGGMFIIGVVLVLYGLSRALILNRPFQAIWYTGAGTIITVVALFLTSAFNNTAFYPSEYDLQSSLTIFNSSSSYFTLKTMAYVSALIPFVVAYIVYFWRTMNRKPLTKEELESHENHVY
ncbi:MAG: cytochrome d ubiquinol oxidase subunit II [Bacteroidales bacterium]|nr:cytochrome d ubiquinol oxidase subunit II [Bacteroidales bacterium]